MFQEEQLDNQRECMALNSASTSSDSDSEVSEVIHQKHEQWIRERNQLVSSISCICSIKSSLFIKWIKTTHFQVDSFLIDGALSGSGSGSDIEPEPEYLLSQVAPPDLQERRDLPPGDKEAVDQETQARLEALLEAAGISRLSGENKQLADPEILRRLTSSVR